MSFSSEEIEKWIYTCREASFLTDAPRAAVRVLGKEVLDLRIALQFYAKLDNYKPPSFFGNEASAIQKDMGELARLALGLEG